MTGFTLVSRRKGNLYVDLKRLTQDPAGLNLIGSLVLAKVYEIAPTADCIGGLEMAPISTSVARLSYLKQKRQLKAFWVRKHLKDHGMQNLIEGNLARGSNAVVADDTITTGGSTVQAIRAVNDAGSRVVQAIGIVDRGAAQNFKNEGVPYFSFFQESDLY